MVGLTVLQNLNTLQVEKQIGGSNRHGTAVFKVIGNTLVDPQTYQKLSGFRWVLVKTKNAEYVVRNVKINGKYLKVQLSREILGLPFATGYRADVPDHINRLTSDNRMENLRVANRKQSTANQGKYGVASRFRGVNVSQNGIGTRFKTVVTVFGTVFQGFALSDEAEAAFLYNCLHKISACKFASLNVIPEDEIPNEERQKKLIDAVNRKLEKDGFTVRVEYETSLISCMGHKDGNVSSSRKRSGQFRFDGIARTSYGSYYARIFLDNGTRVNFRPSKLDIEAGLVYYYALVALKREIDYRGVFPPEEMPSEERQEELWQMVLRKLTEAGLIPGA